MKPEDVVQLRLMVFGAALIAITTRECTIEYDHSICDHSISKRRAKATLKAEIADEARALADLVIEEAKRLEPKS